MTIISFVALFVLVLAISAYQYNKQRAEWNDGTCRYCGGAWATMARDSHGSVGYKCKECGRVIWLDWYRVER